MRSYFTTNIENTKLIWERGFWDMHAEFGLKGVWFASQPLDANDGFEGGVVLCLEIPEETFKQFEVEDELCADRRSLMPATTLNQLGKPMVYDHRFAGMGRRTLVRAAAKGEQGEFGTPQQAEDFRLAIKFFDEIGWLTPMKLREQASQDASDA